MFRKIEIDSILELPYKLIDIGDSDEQFVLAFKCFEENQTDYSIQTGGATGNFEITYKCSGIDSQFEIDITIGNLYYFYNELKTSMSAYLELILLQSWKTMEHLIGLIWHSDSTN